MEEFEFIFDRHQINKIPKETIIKELKRVAKRYNFYYFTRHEYDKVAKLCKGTTVLNNFGTWKNALNAIGVKLKERKVDRSIIPAQVLFKEMERIWKLLGHRPSKTEWDIFSPKYSYTTYKTRFNGWTNACLKFIEYKMNTNIQTETTKTTVPKRQKPSKQPVVKKYKREIPLGLRLKILKRDGFRCVMCGRSPAIKRGIILHIDHKVPIAKGGKTIYRNLQTLCKECNIGKGKS